MKTILTVFHAPNRTHLYVDGVRATTTKPGESMSIPGADGFVLYAGVLREAVEVRENLAEYPEDAWESPPVMLEGSAQPGVSSSCNGSAGRPS